MSMVWIVFWGTLCVAGLAVAADNGSSADAGMLVDAKNLTAMLGGDHVRLLDVRSSDDYSKGHIPNAINIDVSSWKKLDFDDSEAWSKTVRPLGIASDSHVVVYGTKLSDTARAWWLLKYVGVENVSILDGGYESWTKSGGATTTELPTVAKTDFKPDFQLDRLVEIDFLQKSLNDSTVNVLDTRSSGEFDAGHIPGATRLEWSELVAADGRFKTKEELKTLFHDRGIVPAEAAVCY